MADLYNFASVVELMEAALLAFAESSMQADLHHLLRCLLNSGYHVKGHHLLTPVITIIIMQ